jgi:hypothetical protein
LQPSLESVARDTTKGKPISVPVTRTYYIQAEFDIWNYAPAGLDRCGREASNLKTVAALNCLFAAMLHSWIDRQ